MKHAKAGVIAFAVALLALASTASATTLTGSGGFTLGAGTAIEAEAEGTTTLHPPIGDIKCEKATASIVTTNSGGSGVNVSGNSEGGGASACNSSVQFLAGGSLSVEGTGSNNGSVSSTGAELTVEFIGAHCIFKTSSTKIGTLTGSATTGSNATVDISASIPRVGGRSGALCGSSAQWTGSFKITNPFTLNVDK